VAGIGEERHGVRQHAVSRLNCDQRYIENRGNGESGSERCRRMAMVVAMVVAMMVAMMVVMMMTVTLLVRLMRRHMLSALHRPRRC
jgi:hypothetical protein